MDRKFSIAAATTLALAGLSAHGSLILSDDFSNNQQDDWANRGENVRFEEGVLKVSPQSSGQPGAAYHAFNSVELNDGELLRLTVDVSVSRLDGRLRDLRLGLGYADPAIESNPGVLAVPLNGYFITAPSGGNTTDHRVQWNDAEGGTINFFNVSTALVGDIPTSNSVGTEMETWIWEVERSGDDLIFSSSLGGEPLVGDITATGADVIDDFRFNTLGLAYGFSAGETATFDNLTLVVIPESKTTALFMAGGAAILLCVRRRFQHRHAKG